MRKIRRIHDQRVKRDTKYKRFNTHGIGGYITTNNYIARDIILSINNPHARNPTYQQVIDFLKNDKTDLRLYIPGNFMCMDFAFNVQSNALAVNIRCGVIYIDFESGPGHVCNVWHTTDRGLIFTDSQGPKDFDYDPNIDSYDRFVDVARGKPMVQHTIFEELECICDSRNIQQVIITW
jgi:hypothetical protein